MKMIPALSIQGRLMLIAIQTSSLALILSAAGFVAYELVTFRESMVRDVGAEADLIGQQSVAALQSGRPEDAGKNLAAFGAHPHIIAACIYQHGKIFARYSRDASPEFSWPNEPLSPLYRFAGGHLDLFRPIFQRSREVGIIYVQADLKAVNERLNRYAGIGAMVLLTSLLVSLLLASRLQRVISDPLSHLADTAREVSQRKNYSVRAAKRRNDEIGQLTDAFNEMLGQIQQANTDLEKVRAELEVRVGARTRELEQEVAERARAEEGLQQQVSRISMLNQITYAVAARQDLDSMVLVVLQHLEERLPIDYGTAYRVDSENANFIAMVRGPKSQVLSEKLQMPPVIPIAHTAFRDCLSGQMVYVPDLSRSDLPVAQRMTQADMPSAVGAPLIVESKVFGILVLGRQRQDGFSAAEREFLRGLSAHVALAIHQAQLYQDLQKAYNDLRQTQQTVMQQQRLQALGQLASGIAHDINNSLSPVVAYSELLQQMEGNLTPNGRRILENIKTAGEDIAHIVARMREFYRPRNEFEEFVPVQLNELVMQVVELTRPRWRDIPQSRGIVIGIRSDFAADLPPISGNPSELREALTNLILNAIDAMPGGGTISLRSAVVGWPEAAGNPRGRQVVLEVTDTGVGMDTETRRRCLEPFFSTKGQRGTGMGLAMVYGVMERHDGSIEVESEPGRGTTMRLVFPLRESAAATAVLQATPGQLRPLRILCIDDEPLLREVMRQILEADGHEVCVADGGESGVNAFRDAAKRKQPFDAIITDLGMPHINGRRVAQIVKSESPKTPVIMLTGWGALMKANGDVPTQVDGVLSKPPRISEIRDRLVKCLGTGVS